MKIIDGLIQGSNEWHAFRSNHFNASEASALFGANKYNMTRNDLLALKAGGAEKEINSFLQSAFDRGHESEAAARPILEKMIGQSLYPIVATDNDGWLSASFDGVTLDDGIVFEHKLLNKDLVAQVKAGELEPHYYWQLEQQLLISGADKAIFVTSDGTAENMHMMEYLPVPGRAEQLMAAWRQFEIDLSAHVQSAPVIEVVGRAPDDLPALHIEVTGMVTASNLDAFKSNAISVIQGINRDLSTDTDFANAEKTVKWLGGVEEKLKAAKEHALSQTQSIDALFKAIDSIGAEARTTRLELEKLVKARKDGIRIEIQQAAQHALFDHMDTLNKRLGNKVAMPNIAVDFAGVMKGKKTVSSLQDAVDTELARVKIESSAIADKIEINLNSLRELGGNHAALFADAQQLVMKANDDLVLLIKSRIADHEAAEQARIDARVAAQIAEEKRKEKLAIDRWRQEVYAAANKREAEDDARVAASKTEQAASQVARATTKEVRPSNDDLAELVANHYEVTKHQAFVWLSEFCTREES